MVERVKLTPRQANLMRFLCLGYGCKQIAGFEGSAHSTVKGTLHTIRENNGAKSTSELIYRLGQTGQLEPLLPKPTEPIEDAA